MKKILIIFCMISFLASNGYSQEKIKDGTLHKDKLEKIFISKDVSLHIVSPEPIQYADISTKSIIGDLPVKNVLRIKYVPDTTVNYTYISRSLGVITVVGEKFIAQYDVWYTSFEQSVQTQIEILPKNTNPLNVGNNPMSQNDLHNYALQALKKGTKTHAIRSSAFGIYAQVNNVYAVDDYVFIDVTYSNKTNLKYDVDEFRFKIDDKRITKATNVQSIEVKPVYQLYNKDSFKKNYRNVFAFKKFTFPDNKVLAIELTEKQTSGRVITLQLDYSDVLNADTL